MPRNGKSNRQFFTTSDVARYCAVSNDGVLRWIKAGKLRAFTTPGGHYRISAEELRSFMERFDIPIDDSVFEPEEIRTVLVVDDDPDVRKLLRNMLGKRDDLQIDEATDGYEASLKIGTKLPDVVILDVMMPRVDGITLCKSIRNNPATRDIRVLAITGHREPETLEAISDAGADDCLTKPLRWDELHEAVTRLMQSRETVAPREAPHTATTAPRIAPAPAPRQAASGLARKLHEGTS